jgi:hypothetical protein
MITVGSLTLLCSMFIKIYNNYEVLQSHID